MVVRSLKFEFPLNRHILYSKPSVQIMQWFLVFNFGPNRSEAGATKPFWSWSDQTVLEPERPNRSGAGATKPFWSRSDQTLLEPEQPNVLEPE